ncbi:DUF1552 domain-containing protein [Nannocystis pusilla]|uniref:DUF1552 domain-containing protein n=1 Tax=Nannocystis pusilla TaxID=889268 RepID=A0A9X3J267_9BACT|nr:DUF1552 domain-containing protein [Nannocystis pusilla]MCY1011429.1 DUF1552 domain-containing protein [Nannocystis pusilla]
MTASHLRAPRLRRRSFLGGLGLGLGALCLPSLLPRGARAEPPGPVKRLLMLMTEHGTVYQNWRMRPGNLPEDTDWEAPLGALGESDFSEILRPLHGFRDRLLVLDGVGMATGHMTGINEHEEGHATCLTGTLAQPVDGGVALAAGPSIDQIVAGAVAEPGQIASLQVSHGNWAYSYDPSGKALPWITDPWQLYSKLFPNGPVDPNEPPDDLKTIRNRQSSVVDLVREQYHALAPKMSGEDKLKVEQHRDLLHSLGQQLENLANIVCEAPAEPDGGPPWEDPQFYFHRAQVFTTLTTLALSCDLTRVAVLAFSGLRNEHVSAPPGDLHNDYAHQASSDPTAMQVMTNYHKIHAEDFKNILAALDAVPSESGTLLDDTLVVWGNELCTGEHSMNQWPIVMAGATNHFKTGRYVRWAQKNIIKGTWGDEPQGPPHNRLLVSIARAMGADVDQVGETSVTLKGDTQLPTTGELDRLT